MVGAKRGRDDRPRPESTQRQGRGRLRRLAGNTLASGGFLTSLACARVKSRGPSGQATLGVDRSDVQGEKKTQGLALGVSLVLHVVIATLLLLAPASFPRNLDLLTSQEITIEIEDVEPEHADETPPELLPPEPTPVAPEERVEPREQVTPTGAAIVPTPGPEVAVTPEPLIEMPTVEEHPVQEPTPRTDEEMHVMLDPRRVSAGIAFQDGRGPTQPGAPATLHPEGREHGPTAQEAIAQTEAFLGAQASQKAYLSHTRPHVVRRPDGTYHYAGHAFEATIQPDGSVSFSDHPDAQFDGFSTSGSFDATDMFMHAAGQDPYAAEREWFMEETEEIRERLEDEARAGATVASLRRLRGRLRSIWQDETESPSHRRRAIFELWDGAAEDDADGTAARAAVIEFVRETLPAGSTNAYPTDELARLNASRESTLRFNPY